MSIETVKLAIEGRDETRPIAAKAETSLKAGRVAGRTISAIWIISGSQPDPAETLDYYVRALTTFSLTCELVLIVNGRVPKLDSTLRTLQASPLTIRIAQLHRPCDESTAIRAGLETSQGEVIVLLPPYVQSDPAALVEMLGELDRGAHFVASWRDPRIDSRWSAMKSRLFNRITNYMTGVGLHDINSGLRLMTREVSDHLPIYGDLHRFAPILAASQGFKVAEVRVRHLKERRVEQGDNRMGVYLRRVLDLLTLFFLFKFTKKPLRFFGLIGSLCLASGMAVVAGAFGVHLWTAEMVNRPALLVGAVLAVLGAQLFSVGLLGELIIFTHGRELLYQHVTELMPPIKKHATQDSVRSGNAY